MKNNLQMTVVGAFLQYALNATILKSNGKLKTTSGLKSGFNL